MNLASFVRTSGRLPALVSLLLLAPVADTSAQSDAGDRYLDLGPLGGRSTLVESAEGFAVRPDAGGFTATHTDYPNQLSQLFGAAATGIPDLPFPADRLPNHDDQVGGAAGDFDGNGIFGTILAYETNQETLTGLVDAKSLRVVISEEGQEYALTIPGGFLASFRPSLRPLNTNPDPVPAGQESNHYDRSLRVAVGQLDDDPADEAVLAYWTDQEKIQIAVFDLDDGELVVHGIESGLLASLVLEDLDIERTSAISGRSSVGFAIAVGDYDGDRVDEIALVHPNPHVDIGLIEGFNSAEVVIYEFTGQATTNAQFSDGAGILPPVNVRIGSIVPSGGGSFSVPFPGNPGSLSSAGTDPAGTAIRVKRMIAEAANLPYAPRPAIDRLGSPRESLVVGLQMQQENINQAFFLPGALVWLRPSRFAEDCSGSTNGDTTYCLTNSQPVLNHARTDPPSYIDFGIPLPSNFCMAAGNLDNPNGVGGDARDELAMMYDPHLVVLRGVPDGADLRSSDQPVPSDGVPTQSLVNVDPDGPCATGAISETAGACATIGGFNRSSNGALGQQCSLTITDVNGHQPLASQPGGELRPEIMLDLREGVLTFTGFPPVALTNQRAFIIEVDADDLSRNDPHQVQYVNANGAAITNAFALFADVDGDSVMLTEPVSRYTVGVDQPLVFLGAPPIHFDVVDDGGMTRVLDPADCFPELTCPFTAQYTSTSASSNTLSHTYTADWYVSNTTSGCVGDCTFGLGSKTEFSLTTAYGEQFSDTSSSTIAGGNVSARSTIAGVDEALIESNRYEIWEYGILCDEVDGVACDLDDTVAVVTPAIDDVLFERWPRPDVDFGDYPLTHEGGNLLSYKSTTDLETLIASEGLPTYTPATPTTFGVSVTALTDEEISYQETMETEKTKGSIFSIDGSVSGSGSIGIVSASTSFSGGYSETDFVSKQATVSSADSFLISLGQLPTNDDRYSITAIAYLKNGAFVLDYGVDGPTPCQTLDPGCIQQFHPDSFFNFYTNDPDPAFRLPQRLDVEKGLGTNTGDRTRQTSEILILPVNQSGDQEPGDPAEAIRPGTRVALRTRVHNYSLVDLEDTDPPVTVSFYNGDPDLGGTFIGSQVISDGIDARGTKEIPNAVLWDIPAMSDSAFDNARVYAELTTGANEIHTNNNIAWRKLSRSFVPEPGAGPLGAAALACVAAIARRRGRIA